MHKHMAYLFSSIASWQGLQDDIHTVVIQALNAFEKIFPCVVSKYLILPTAYHQHSQQQQQQVQVQANYTQSTTAEPVEVADKSGRKCHANAAGQVPQQQQRQENTNDATKSSYYTHATSSKSPAMAKLTSSSSAAAAASASKTCPRVLFNDNDALIAALLNDFQLQSKSNRNGIDNTTNTNDTNTQPQTGSNTSNALPPPVAFRISPKLLLNKLRLCHYNKYWLVQNKYAEVISNLNYAALHGACNDCHGYCCGGSAYLGCVCDAGCGDDGGDHGFGEVLVGNAAGGGDGGSVFDVAAVNNPVNATLPGGAGKAASTTTNETANVGDMLYNIADDSVCIYEVSSAHFTHLTMQCVVHLFRNLALLHLSLGAWIHT